MRHADRKFMKIAMERNYLKRAQAEQLLAAVRERGLPADQLAIDMGLLSDRRVRRLQNHLLYRTMRKADKVYATLAQRTGVVPRPQLERALQLQKVRFRETRARQRLGSILIELGQLSDEQDRDLRLRVSGQPTSDEAPTSAIGHVNDQTAEVVSEMGVELASELGGLETGLGSEQEEFLESDMAIEDPGHLAAANAETRIIDDDPPKPLLGSTKSAATPIPAAQPAAAKASTESCGVAIPLEPDEEERAVDEAVERTTTRYRAIDEAVTRVEAIRKVQHDLSNSGMFMAKDSAELFERACRARACNRLTGAEETSAGSANSTAAGRAVRAAEQAEREEREAQALLWELESQVQPAPVPPKPKPRWKAAGLRALLGKGDDAA